LEFTLEIYWEFLWGIDRGSMMYTTCPQRCKIPIPPLSYLCHICAILGLKTIENDGIGLKIGVNTKLI